MPQDRNTVKQFFFMFRMADFNNFFSELMIKGYKN